MKHSSLKTIREHKQSRVVSHRTIDLLYLVMVKALPFLKGFFSHLSGCPVDFFWNGVFLSLGDLVDGVSRVQPVWATFTPESCCVSATCKQVIQLHHSTNAL